MRKFMIPAAVAALALSSSFALAGQGDGIGSETESVGVISSWDAQSHKLNLTDGSSIMVPAKYATASFKAGDKVKIVYETLASGSRVDYVGDIDMSK